MRKKTRSGSESELEGAEQDDSWWTGGGSKSRLSVKKKTRRVNRIHGFTGVPQYIQGHSAFDQVAFQPVPQGPLFYGPKKCRPKRAQQQ